MASIALVAIRSARFPQAFLRMDGSGVNQFEGGGSGTVNCQFYAQGYPSPNIGNDEVFELIPLGKLSSGQGYAIRSLNYPQAFLRMDGSKVNQFEAAGSGTINCQFYRGGTYPQNNRTDWEHFMIGPSLVPATPSHPNLYGLSSGEFPGVFLRIDGSQVNQFEAAGSGTVNCQYYSTPPSSADDYEVFEIIYLQPPVSP